MIKRLLVVLLALVLVFGGVFAWKAYQVRQMMAQAEQPPPPATVAAAQVQVETWQPYLSAVGSLRAVQGVAVANEVAGQVASIHFESGQRVEAGALLLRLDDAVDRAELNGLIAQRRLAQTQFARSERLLAQRNVSQSDFDEARAALQNAAAQVEAKRAFIDKKALHAPFAGLLGLRRVDVGEYLPPGTEIVSLQALDRLYVDYALPERHLARLAEGQPVQVSVQAFAGERFAGRIDAINSRVDAATRSIQVRAVLDNPGLRLRPGMFAEVRTALPAREQVLTLPRTAIAYNPYGDSVFVIQEQGDTLVVQRRQVQTGEVRGDRVEIRGGLEAGARVVSAGQVKLRNGQAVRIDASVALDGEVDGP